MVSIVSKMLRHVWKSIFREKPFTFLIYRLCQIQQQFNAKFLRVYRCNVSVERSGGVGGGRAMFFWLSGHVLTHVVVYQPHFPLSSEQCDSWSLELPAHNTLVKETKVKGKTGGILWGSRIERGSVAYKHVKMFLSLSLLVSHYIYKPWMTL